MNNFVKSNPADDFLARLRVLITSPEGSTTVYKDIHKVDRARSGNNEPRSGTIPL